MTQKPEILDFFIIFFFCSIKSSASAALMPQQMSLCNCLVVGELRAVRGSAGEAGSLEGLFH